MTPLALLLGMLFWHGQTSAQKLPPPARTVYKCEQAGKVVYSDSPCLGAERIDLQPTRGLNKSSGKEQVGSDVRREQNREMMAEALRPITGMDARQFDQSGRRLKLSPEKQKLCKSLDREIPELERREKATSSTELDLLQKQLLSKRASYRNNGCE